MSGLLLDTHIALWLDSDHPNLRERTAEDLQACWSSGGQLILSVMSVWEIALLTDLGRIRPDVPAREWVRRFLDRPGVALAGLTTEIACLANELPDLAVRDAADRLLIATAIELRCPLVTYDERIAAYAAGAGRRHGFAAMA